MAESQTRMTSTMMLLLLLHNSQVSWRSTYFIIITLLFPMCRLCKVHKWGREMMENTVNKVECFVIADFTTVINCCLNIYARRILFLFFFRDSSLFLPFIWFSKDEMIFHFAMFLTNLPLQWNVMFFSSFFLPTCQPLLKAFALVCCTWYEGFLCSL